METASSLPDDLDPESPRASLTEPPKGLSLAQLRAQLREAHARLHQVQVQLQARQEQLDAKEQALQALARESTAQARQHRCAEQVARLAQLGHWQWDAGSDTLAWSDETYQCFGYASGQIQPTLALFLDHVLERDRQRVSDLLQQVLRQADPQRPRSVEFGFRRADGAWRVGRLLGEARRDAEGHALSISGALQDITELRHTEQLFHAAFNASPMGTIVSRLGDGVFLDVNDRFAASFGWSAAQARGRSGLDLNLWVDTVVRDLWREQLRQHSMLPNFETQWRHRSGEVRQVSLSAQRIDVDSEPLVLTFVNDITAHKQAQARVDFLAHHDPLTGLPNRVLFRDRFELSAAWARQLGHKMALLNLDLDHFKTINDTLGHPAGDQVLQQVAQRLQQVAGSTSTISRQGGDEFLIALGSIQDEQRISHIAAQVIAAMTAPLHTGGQELEISLSMGIAVWPDDGEDFDTLLQCADTALYQAKAAGRDTWRFYTPAMNEQALEQLQLRTLLRRALEQRQFVLYYQPQIDLASGALVGVEALVRLQREDGAIMAPGQFIAAAEDSGLIVPLGEWVLREACAQAMRWQQQGLPALTVAVNLSAVQFRRGDLLHSVTQALTDAGLAPQRLELELTESILIDDAEQMIDQLRRLKALGVCLSIDDFGTGYSSLAYLKRLAVDKLKIDQSFVRDIAGDPDDAAIVRAIISMARSLKLQVIAEGVETADAATLLRMHQCHEAQGWHFARPMPAQDLPGWLEQYQGRRGA
ncbi:hypothetical protein GCM10022279_23100 [Comamonas faecalis]|uniref:EAL domain-containing protein n=2 Tax=Comamonas faecalis TaxID=1387849 RepID=A0ABP7RKK2_9BURK